MYIIDLGDSRFQKILGSSDFKKILGGQPICCATTLYVGGGAWAWACGHLLFSSFSCYTLPIPAFLLWAAPFMTIAELKNQWHSCSALAGELSGSPAFEDRNAFLSTQTIPAKKAQNAKPTNSTPISTPLWGARL